MIFKRYRLYPRIVRDLKKRSIAGIAFYPVITSIVLFADGFFSRHADFSTRFLVLISAMSLFRAAHIPFSAWMAPRFERVNTLVFFGSVLLTALIWGVGLAKFLAFTGEENAKLLMVMCSIGLTSGAMVGYLPDRRLAILSGVLLILPTILAQFARQENYPLSILMGLFLLYMISMVVRSNKEYWIALENEYRLEEKTQDLERLSRTDSLTGLFNRRYFDELFNFEWQRAVRKQTPIAIILADIDRFKLINDRYGHPAGDAYLISISDIFRQVFRRSTDVIARYGGEEFIVMMPDEPCEKATALAEDLGKAVREMEVPFDGHDIRTTISIGVSVCTAEGKGQGNLISKADTALYKSKQNGRDCVTTEC